MTRDIFNLGSKESSINQSIHEILTVDHCFNFLFLMAMLNCFVLKIIFEAIRFFFVMFFICPWPELCCLFSFVKFYEFFLKSLSQNELKILPYAV